VFYWEGVTLSEKGRVTGISLPDNNIQGNLPEEMGTLTEIKVLNLDNNPVTGEILLPDKVMKDTIFISEETLEILTVRFNEEEGYLEEISILLEDTGYFEDLSIVVDEEYIVLSWGGGG